MRVLVAEDEASMRSALGIMLAQAGYDVIEAADGQQAVERFRDKRPDLVILDIMMPKLSGFEACEAIRAMDANVPVLFLSAKGDIVDKKVGYKVGGDDYVVKPFNEEELLLRVDALLRRSGRNAAQTRSACEEIESNGLRMNFRRHEVRVDGRPVDLTPKEFQILATLAERPGEVFSREELIESVWGASYSNEPVGIAVYIRRIREKIEDNPSKPVRLQTVWRVGYRFGDG